MNGKRIDNFIKLSRTEITKTVVEVLSGKESSTKNITKNDGSAIKLKTKAKPFAFENEPYLVIIEMTEVDK